MVPCFYDGRELAVEVIKEYIDVKDDENLILISRYFPKENKLSDHVEVIIKNNITVWDFQNVVKSMTDIPLENIAIAKPFTTFSLLTNDSKTLSWRRHVAEDVAQQKLSQEFRWTINDGEYFFYKDITEDPPVDVMTPHSSSSDSGSSSSIPADFFKPVVVTRIRREEKALKIKTRYVFFCHFFYN
jgi:hypothetical protein